jgi:MFS family permease
MTLVIAGLAVLLLARFDPAANRPSDLQADGAQPRHAWPTRGTLILVVACLSAMVLEGAGAEWSAIYMRDTFAASPFVAGAAIASGAGFQAVTRWWAGGAIDRFGPVKVGRALHMVLATGGLLVFLAEHPAVAMAGFALMGIGTSAIFPMAMSAAAQATDRAAALNVAALAQTAFIAFLVGPPLLGSVATQWGIRWSYGITLPLVLLGFWATKALDPKTR